MKVVWLVGVILAMAAPASSELDPSIFDGTGVRIPEAGETPEPGGTERPPEEPEEDNAGGNEEGEAEASADSQSGTDTREAESGPVPPLEAGEPSDGSRPEGEDEEDSDLGEAEETGGPPGMEEEETDAPPEAPGVPAPAASQSRAGERVETTDRVAPGQAVDLPWDM